MTKALWWGRSRRWVTCLSFKLICGWKWCGEEEGDEERHYGGWGRGGMQEGRDQDAAQPETEVRASVRNHQIGDNTQSNASLRGNICLDSKHMVDIRKT